MSESRQRYEIYINSGKLILLDEVELPSIKTDPMTLVMGYKGQQKSLFQYLDILEKTTRFSSVILYSPNVKQLFSDLKELVNKINAAGGVIVNQENKILLIFRRGYWDLPKGKLDDSESFEDAAIRECREEVGLQDLDLESPLTKTFHFYRDKKYGRCIKKTKWYVINHPGGEELKPQIEEDIEKVIWIPIEEAILQEPMYESIKEVLKSYNQMSLTK